MDVCPIFESLMPQYEHAEESSVGPPAILYFFKNIEALIRCEKLWRTFNKRSFSSVLRVGSVDNLRKYGLNLRTTMHRPKFNHSYKKACRGVNTELTLHFYQRYTGDTINIHTLYHWVMCPCSKFLDWRTGQKSLSTPCRYRPGFPQVPHRFWTVSNARRVYVCLPYRFRGNISYWIPDNF